MSPQDQGPPSYKAIFSLQKAWLYKRGTTVLGGILVLMSTVRPVCRLGHLLYITLNGVEECNCP
jgi:hypothetical protein